jgi:putative Mg2+ transporter-C (MgtC) family protein
MGSGRRTHMLVSVGSALLIIVSAYGFTNATQMPHVVLDPSRVAAQVVSGIGFLGAGSILLRGQVVKGLTTAASIWSVAAIGLASGAGLYFAAGLATAIILLILIGIKPLEEAYRARVQSAVVKVSAERGALDPEGIKKQLGLRGGQIRRMTAVPGDDDLDLVTLNLVKVSQRDIRMTASRLKDAPGVQEVTIGKLRKVRDGDGERLL